MLDDAALLRRFADESDEHAFAELLERHVNLVYSAALRQTTGDVQLAQDVTQTVFTDLARKAGAVVKSLESGTPFVGWLYTSTRFAARSVLRGEQRRRSREHIACIMNEGSNPGHLAQEPVWEDLRPILDELMSKLSDLDRNAILLRYFEGKELREVGKILGLSGEATRKRVARALERLRYLLVRRDIKTTGSALAAALAANAVQMAPREFARYLARLSLARAASTLTPVATTHALLAIVAANAKIVISLLVGVLVMSVMASSLIRRSRIRPTGQRVDQTSPVSAAKVPESGSSPRPIFAPTPEDAALSRLRAALTSPGILRSMSPEVQSAMLDLGAQREKALPILREALNDRTWEVRRRAAFTLGAFSLRGPNLANALIPEIIQMLHDSGTDVDAMASDAALQVAGIQTDSIPALLTILRENPIACSLAGNSIFNLVKSDPEAARKVVEQLKPLKDSDPMIQETARELTVKLSTLAPDEKLIIPLIDQLKTGDDAVKTEALHLLETISLDFPVRASLALKEFLKQPNREDLKENADQILMGHDPSYSKEREDPGLKQIEASEELAFLDKARRGQATVHELAAALRLYPSAIPETANALKAIGYDEMRRRSNESIQETQDFSSVIMMLPLIIYGHRNEPFETRLAASDALRELQPARERLLYTVQEVAPAFDTIHDALPRLPEEKRVKLEAFFRLMVDLAQTRCERSGEITDYFGGDLRTFARQIETADRTTFDDFVAAMRKVDPNFLQ